MYPDMSAKSQEQGRMMPNLSRHRMPCIFAHIRETKFGSVSKATYSYTRPQCNWCFFSQIAQLMNTNVRSDFEENVGVALDRKIRVFETLIRVGFGHILSTPSPTAVKTADSERLRLRL